MNNLQVFDAWYMDWPTLGYYTELAAQAGMASPNDKYLEENAGPFLLVPVCNTTDFERLVGVMEVPGSKTPKLPELPDSLTVSKFFSIIDGSVNSMKEEQLLVFLEVPITDSQRFKVVAQRLPKPFLNMVRVLGLEFLARQMRSCDENEAADALQAEADKLRERGPDGD